jgi:hypothetical protein
MVMVVVIRKGNTNTTLDPKKMSMLERDMLRYM